MQKPRKIKVRVYKRLGNMNVSENILNLSEEKNKWDKLEQILWKRVLTFSK